MKLAMIGLGRMGMNMARRLLTGGHRVVAYNRTPDKTEQMVAEGAEGAFALEEVTAKLDSPRIVWLMLPAGRVVDEHIDRLAPLLAKNDILIDGGNSFYKDDIRRAAQLEPQGIHYMDAGVSGGIWGLKIGYCTMIGGNRETYDHRPADPRNPGARKRVPLLWKSRCRPLRQNGPQRHRIWDDAGLRGRIRNSGGIGIRRWFRLRRHRPPLEPGQRHPFMAAGIG